MKTWVTSGGASRARLVDELLGRVPLDWVEDVVSLADVVLHAWSDPLVRPAILNPTFALSRAVGGTDADLIVGGGATRPT